MSTNGEGGTKKSRKSAAKVGGEFSAVGGIVVVGGVLVVGIAAAAIACLRRRPRKKMPENPAEKSGESSCLPMSENMEEVEPILEIANMEKLSSSMDLELSANDKNVNRSKGDESPRSHFSLSTSFATSASASSDSEDLVEINQMSSKEKCSVPLEETSGKTSFDFRMDRESECISGKELVEPNVEYEESVDSFDGLEDTEKVVNDCKESGQSSLVCKERLDAEECVEFVGGDKDSIEDDGSMHDEKFHVPIEGIDAADVFCEGRIVEIDVLKVSEFGKGDLCLDREEDDQMGADSMEETVLFNKEDLQEKVGGSEGMNCDKEECWQAVIGEGEGLTSVKEDCSTSEDVPRRERDSNVDFGHYDERVENGKVDISEECFGPIQQQSLQETVGTDQEVLLRKEGCQQEKLECNEGRCGEENIDSEESDNHMVNVSCKEEQCSTVVSRDFESSDYSRDVGHCEEKCQHGEMDFSEETSRHTEEEIQQESFKPKESQSIEVDDYSRQDAAPHELSNAKEEIHFCKEKHPEQKTFESNVEQCLRERVNSEEKPEEKEVDLAHEGEQCQHGTDDSRGFEVLDYEGTFSLSDENGQQKEEFLEQNCSPINETAQNKELERGEAEVHDRQDGRGQVSVGVNECMLQREEQSIQEENLELNVKHCPQEKTDAEYDLKGKLCQHGTVDFGGLDYEGGSNNGDEVGQVQHGELEDSDENLVPINEQFLQETLEHEELDCKELEVSGHQDGHKSEPDGANKEEKSVLNVEQCSQEKTECMAAVANKGEQCQIGKVDSRNFGGLDEDASHENGSCQYGDVGMRELDDLNRDSHSEKGQCENERLISKEDIQNEQFENGSVKSMEDIENEQFENGKLNSKEFAELDIGLEEKLRPQEENIKEPQEALVVSVMEMEYEENAVHPKETGVDGDAHIVKEKSQQEAMDSNESQNSVEDIFVNHELCKGTTCEPKESEFVNESMSIAQEENKQEIVDSVDIEDSVECIPVMTLQCHREINESDELEDVAITEPQKALEMSVMEEESEENAVQSKETGIDGDAHIFKEKPKQEAMDSNESQNFVEDIFVNHELCKGTTCESKESDLVEENMPIAQEEYKQEIVDSVDMQDSVEYIPISTLQCHKEINEPDELEGVAIKEPQEALEVSVMEMECEEDAVHAKETGVDGDDAHIVKEKPQQEAMDSNESQNFVEDIFANHELCKGTTYESKESDLVEENMPIAQEEYKQEIVDSVDIQDAVECLPVTTLQCHREINELDELEGVAVKEPEEALEVPVMEMECEENAVHSKETSVEDAHIVKEKPQQEAMDSNESQNFVEDIFVNHELCKGTTCESKESDFVDENMPIAQKENKQEIVDSVDIQDSVECIPITTLQCLREINESDELEGVAIKEPREELQVSVMEMECEENAVHAKETDVDGDDAHIVKEKPQQEAMDSNESQNFVEDILVNHELCKGTTCESKESDFVEENMPIAQEENKQEIVDSVDIQDSVECIPITTLQCNREINESDELEVVAIKEPQEALEVPVMEMECEENAVHSKETGVGVEGVAIPGEKYQGDAVYLEQLELSDYSHSHNEPCEQSPPSQKEIVALKETNDLEYLNHNKQSQEKEIDAKDLEYSSSIVLESSHEDPQTYNKPEVIGTKDSEYSYGDTTEKEYQLETDDEVPNHYYKEDQEICPEQEEISDEKSSTHTHHLNDQSEANQDISTTITSESCKLPGVLKEFNLDDESTESNSVASLESEPSEDSNTSPITEREKKGWDPLHSSQLVSNSEEGKSLCMKPQRPLYMRTRIIVPLLAALLAFLFACKLANMPESVYAFWSDVQV